MLFQIIFRRFSAIDSELIFKISSMYLMFLFSNSLEYYSLNIEIKISIVRGIEEPVYLSNLMKSSTPLGLDLTTHFFNFLYRSLNRITCVTYVPINDSNTASMYSTVSTFQLLLNKRRFHLINCLRKQERIFFTAGAR